METRKSARRLYHYLGNNSQTWNYGGSSETEISTDRHQTHVAQENVGLMTEWKGGGPVRWEKVKQFWVANPSDEEVANAINKNEDKRLMG